MTIKESMIQNKNAYGYSGLTSALSRKKINILDLLTIVFVVILTFQSLISTRISIFQYFDEILSLGVFILGILLRIYNGSKINRFDLTFMILIFAYELAGWISYALQLYQNFFVTLMGGYLQIKFFILIIGMKWLLRCSWFRNRFYRSLHIACVISLWLLFLIDSVSLIRTGGNLLGNWDICGKVVFLMSGILMTNKKTKIEYVTFALGIILLLLTSSAKAYGAIALLCLLDIWVIKLKKKAGLKELCVFGLIIICVAWKKIYYYYIHGMGSYARSVLTLKGLEIAKDYFPFGTGWSTFASYGAEKNYSPLYFIYGISNHQELGILYKKYLTDVYWPSVIAESGFLGFICIVLLLILILYSLQKLYAVNLNKYCAGLFSLGYMIITTFEESGFMQPVLLYIGIIIGMLLYNEQADVYR